MRTVRAKYSVWFLLIAGAVRAEDDYFRAQVAPILEQHCVRCHEGTKPKGGLSLSTSSALRAGGESGSAIVPGNPEESLLLDYVSGDKPLMPKDDKPLTKAQTDTLKEWIANGADWSADLQLSDKRRIDRDWWSLRSLIKPPLPNVESQWVRTPIDKFILAKLNEHGLLPSPEADRRNLIRRLYFDLLGLPPSFAEVQNFVDDDSPRAYENLVERLLASPHYGERWGRHWLDIVHYGDTHGYDKDKVRPNAWPYRDYVIRAFNEDKPYRRFIEEQVAGDILYPAARDGIVATGFVVAGPFDYVGQVELEEQTLAKAITRNLDRDDMVTTTISTFNSMTAHCARCHNHKFDPITQSDYYSLQSVFSGIDRADRAIAGEKGPNGPRLVFAAATEFTPIAKFAPTHGRPRPVFVLNRGNEKEPLTEASPGTCGYLPELDSRFAVDPAAAEGARRVALAGWLADNRNVLTWRSIVNRIWQYHFGRGIVDSPNDFGRMGSLPTHPELLDWLAVEFRDGGQSIKQLHRLICTSAVYRQSSAGNGNFALTDAGNQYLWRMHRRRLEAEAVRDSILAVAGKLNPEQGGPPYRGFAFQDDESPRYDYGGHDPDDTLSQRRSVYRLLVRSVPDPFMTTLDCADASALVAKRNETATPLQSLALLNNRFILRMAEHFAVRVESIGANTKDHLTAAWRIALGRDPTTAELSLSAEYAEQHGLANTCRLIFNLNEFVFID